MEQRTLGRTGRQISAVGFGAWQIGGSWGTVDDDDALSALRTSVEAGVTFVDTADVYGDGRSERLIGRLLAEHPDLTVATKMGRRLEQVPENYSRENFLAWNDRSRRNLDVDTIDLVQLHCPPTPVYSDDAVFDALDEMVADGRIAAYGVSVETTEQALTAIARPGIATVQIILNALRHKPIERVLPAARAAGVGIIARVPLASGLLTGKLTATSTFAEDDHRRFNRQGEAFDVGETFAGVNYEIGLAAVERLRGVVPADVTMTQFALRWILDLPGVSVVIPGARNARQAQGNAVAASLPALTADQHRAVTEVYDELIRPHVHHRW